jgi:outer membrane protein
MISRIHPKYALVWACVLHGVWLLTAGGCRLPSFPLFAFLTPSEESHKLRSIDGIALEKESTSRPKRLGEAAIKDSTTGPGRGTEELPPPAIPPSGSNAASDESKSKKPIVLPAERLVLTLADARASALEANLDLKVEEVNPAIARQAISEEAGKFEATFNSTYVRERVDPPPGVLLGGDPDTTFDRFTNTITQPCTSGGQLQVLHNVTKSDIHFSDVLNAVNTDVGVAYRQPLLRGFGYQVNTANIQIARAQTGIADTQSKLTAIRVLSDVERAYWQLYASRKFLDIALEQLDLAKKQNAVATKLVDAGVFTSVEELVAESGVAVRQNAAIQAETNVRIAERDLKRIMQRPDAPVNSATKIELATDPNPLGLEFNRQHLANRGVQNRMEMLALQLQLLSQSIEREVQQNSTLPELDLKAQVDVLGLESSYRKSMDVLFDNEFGDRLVGIELQVPLSGNVSARARLRAAQLRMMQTRIQQDQVATQITEEVFNAVDRVEQNWERVVATRQAEFVSERAYNGQVRLQEAGRQTVTDVLVALQNLGDAKAQAVQAVTDYQTSKVDLALATGAMLGYGQVDWSPCCGPQSPLPDVKFDESNENPLPSLLQPESELNLPPTLPVEPDETSSSVPSNPAALPGE